MRYLNIKVVFLLYWIKNSAKGEQIVLIVKRIAGENTCNGKKLQRKVQVQIRE